MAGLAEIGAGKFPELVGRAVRRVMDLRLDRLGGEDAPDLIERHALPRQHLARKNHIRPFGEHIVLGEGAVGLVFRGHRRRGRLARSGPSRSEATPQ